MSSVAYTIMSYNTLEEALAVTTDPPFIIDKDLRTIKVPENYILGVYNDKDVLSIPFVLPRFYYGIDLSSFSIRINYRNAEMADNSTDAINVIVGTDVINFDWLVGAGAFVKAGIVKFSVCVRQIDNSGAILKEFNTTTCRAKVLDGLEAENPNDPEQYSILFLMQEYAERASTAASASETAVSAATRAESAASTAVSAAQTAQAYVGAPLVAATSSAMTDQTRIYVYTGAESEYVYGNWYYWNGSRWANGGTYSATDGTSGFASLTARKKTIDSTTNVQLTGLTADCANDRLFEAGVNDTITVKKAGRYKTTISWYAASMANEADIKCVGFCRNGNTSTYEGEAIGRPRTYDSVTMVNVIHLTAGTVLGLAGRAEDGNTKFWLISGLIEPVALD